MTRAIRGLAVLVAVSIPLNLAIVAACEFLCLDAPAPGAAATGADTAGCHVGSGGTVEARSSDEIGVSAPQTSHCAHDGAPALEALPAFKSVQAAAFLAPAAHLTIGPLGSFPSPALNLPGGPPADLRLSPTVLRI